MLRKRAPTVATPRNFGAGHSCDSASWRPWVLLAPPRHDFPHQHPQHKWTLPCGPTFTPVRSDPEQPLLWGQPSNCPPSSPSPSASPGLGACWAPITPHLFLSLTAAPPFPEALLSPTDPSRTPCPGFPASCPPSSPRICRLHVRPGRGDTGLCHSRSWTPGPSCQFHLP